MRSKTTSHGIAMLNREYTLYEKRDGTCGIVGIEHNTLKCFIAAESATHLIMYIPGRTGWWSREKHYFPPELAVLRKAGEWSPAKAGSYFCRSIEVLGYNGDVSLEMGRGWIKRALRKRIDGITNMGGGQ